MNFDLDSATRRRLGYHLIDQIDGFFASLPDRAVQLPSEQRTFGALQNALPETGEDPDQVLDTIFREMVDKGFHVPSANYFGLMNPTPTYIGVMAELIVAGLNPQLATVKRSQLASKIEQESVRWVGERVGWTGEFGGTFTTGGNEANFSGMALGIAAKFPKAIEDGICSIGAQPVLYASEEAHHSIDKSAGLLGIGRKALRRISVTESIEIDVQALEKAIAEDIAGGKRPFCVVATAGTTNTGAVDDIKGLAEICRRHNLWLHVDGAYGGSAVFSDKHREIVRGIELADSIAIDPHKWLAMPLAAGVILTRHPEMLERAFAVTAPYMPKAAEAKGIDNSRISTQWTRRMNSLKLWLTLRVHGRRAYEEHINRQMRLAKGFADWIRSSAEFELAAPQAMPIVTFRLKKFADRFKDLGEAHGQIVDEVTRDGRRWISETRVRDESVLRMMVISYLTEERHLQSLQKALVNAAALRG
ncbi:MAG TPA: aminotransferase class I/II-fold pyridoxal phosphate-dependent enzyme [Terriglobales bacterium]|jgi:glutamate/tyrosine decarboxylase-like PLP-dependent enzyme|nr:aminotransferase class I/II-fold pyridoxal phosphate-dependent enzyme [Terriglobales bacterium]